MLKTCDICGDEFDAQRSAKRCSDACKEEATAKRDAARYEANKEAILERQAAYYGANKEAIAERKAAWRDANKEALREQQAAYQQANKEAIAQRKAAHRQTPTGKATQAKAKAKRRGAAVRESDPTFIKADRCVRCGSTHDLEVEHMTPISQGGTNYIENLTTMCAPCNRGPGGKHTKGPQDWPTFVAWFLWDE